MHFLQITHNRHMMSFYLTVVGINMTDSTVFGEEIQYAVYLSKQMAFPEHLAQTVDRATLVT
jgi:hypothetical protein